MVRQGLGLTRLHGIVDDEKQRSHFADRFRECLIDIDRLVLQAYGWSDLDLGHGFYETKQGIRFTISEAARQEVLDRLLALNHERYQEEVRHGLHDKKTKKGTARTSAPSASSEPKRASKRRPTQTALDLGEPPPPQIGFDFDSPETSAPPAGGAADALSPDAAALLAALRASPTPLGKSALLEGAGLDPRSWKAAIDELKSKHLVTQHGERRGAAYAAADGPEGRR